ncbi:MAG TPA: DUF3347 domain-containing protein [Cyclobacteriaceae bacterium]
MKTKMMMFCLALVGWGAYAQHDHAGHGDQKKMDQSMVMFKDAKLGAAYEYYIHIKDALVASKTDEAKMGAGELQKALKDVNGSAKAIELSEKFASASNLAEQRKVFSTLSNEMTALVKAGKLSMGALYLEYCPMANNNEGAYWLSNEKEIKNPYFGDRMLKCGSVKETIQ